MRAATQGDNQSRMPKGEGKFVSRLVAAWCGAGANAIGCAVSQSLQLEVCIGRSRWAGLVSNELTHLHKQLKFTPTRFHLCHVMRFRT